MSRKESQRATHAPQISAPLQARRCTSFLACFPACYPACTQPTPQCLHGSPRKDCNQRAYHPPTLAANAGNGYARKRANRQRIHPQTRAAHIPTHNADQMRACRTTRRQFPQTIHTTNATRADNKRCQRFNCKTPASALDTFADDPTTQGQPQSLQQSRRLGQISAAIRANWATFPAFPPDICGRSAPARAGALACLLA